MAFAGPTRAVVPSVVRRSCWNPYTVGLFGVTRRSITSLAPAKDAIASITSLAGEIPIRTELVVGGAAIAGISGVLLFVRSRTKTDNQSPQSVSPPEECDLSQSGAWRLDKKRSGTLLPYLKGLGFQEWSARLLDALPVDLKIVFKENNVEVVDETLFIKNTISAEVGGVEVETTSRLQDVSMLSAFRDTSKDGLRWLTMKRRLFQRGDGWQTLQSWAVEDEGRVLHEHLILQRPNEEDVEVDRFYFKLLSQEEEQDNTKLLVGLACYALVTIVGVTTLVKALNDPYH